MDTIFESKVALSPFEQLQKVWPEIEKSFLSSAPIQRLARGELTVEHYATYLRETYFYTREDPQIQVTATAYFKGADRELVKPFLQHATSEVGHDQLALDDLAVLGFATDKIPGENPLPATIALTAYGYYSAQFRSAGSYLGYLYFLEFLPTSSGGMIADALRAVGVPDQAMTFLLEHNAVDVHHNRLMKVYADHMLRTAADIAEVEYSIRVTAKLFENMLTCAFDAVDKGECPLHGKNGAG